VRGRTSLGRGRVIHIFGDSRSTGRYFHLLGSLMNGRGISKKGSTLNFEPLETLAFMLKMPSFLRCKAASLGSQACDYRRCAADILHTARSQRNSIRCTVGNRRK
jgi:hypothetical protein